MAVKDKRAKDFLTATGEATKGLSDEEARLATAIFQPDGRRPRLDRDAPSSGAWTGEQMAVGVGWAMRTLLADLHARKAARSCAKPGARRLMRRRR